MPTIMLVDDEALSLFSMRTLLSRNFSDVTVIAEAETGEEAVRLYDQLRPDGVLMDIRIPRMNGLEASRRILEKHPMASILICSAYDSFSLVAEALDIGVKGYLLKPLQRDEAVKKIERLLHAQVSAIERFADQQILSLLTTGGMREATKLQIERAFGKLDKGILMTVVCKVSDEEICHKLGYALKKHAPTLGFLFAGELECNFAAIAISTQKEGFWHEKLQQSVQDAGVAGAKYYTFEINHGDWVNGWNQLVRTITTEKAGDRALNLLNNIDQYVRDEALASLSLDGLAQEIGVSPQHLSSTFKETVGINFIEYMTLRRMRLAARLLQADGSSVVSVAYACGYADPVYFRRLFMKHYGMTPQEYRKY